MSSKKHYERRDVESLGQHYMAHLAAMTAESLHDKCDIAAELAYRDADLAALRTELEQVKASRDEAVQRAVKWRDSGSRIAVEAENLKGELADTQAQLAQALADGEAGPWQPIETAPKDGRPILVFDPSRDRSYYIPQDMYGIIDMSDPRIQWYDDGRWAIGYWRPRGGWGNRNQVVATPTHWMPLPAEPSAVSAVEGDREIVAAAKAWADACDKRDGVSQELRAMQIDLSSTDSPWCQMVEREADAEVEVFKLEKALYAAARPAKPEQEALPVCESCRVQTMPRPGKCVYCLAAETYRDHAKPEHAQQGGEGE